MGTAEAMIGDEELSRFLLFFDGGCRAAQLAYYFERLYNMATKQRVTGNGCQSEPQIVDCGTVWFSSERIALRCMPWGDKDRPGLVLEFSSENRCEAVALLGEGVETEDAIRCTMLRIPKPEMVDSGIVDAVGGGREVVWLNCVDVDHLALVELTVEAMVDGRLKSQKSDMSA